MCNEVISAILKFLCVTSNSSTDEVVLTTKYIQSLRICFCCQESIIHYIKKHKLSNTSKIQISDCKITCRDLALSDLMCYTCYVCCLSKNQKKTPRGKQKRQKNGRKGFFKKKYQVQHVKSLKTRSLNVFLESIVKNYDAYRSL